MTRLFIIADDITGAADAAAPFATGLPTTVRVRSDSPITGAAVESINTETRNTDAKTAAERVRAATRSALANPGAQIVKKIDSLMRGHVGVEVSALLQELSANTHGLSPIAVVAPAFPAVCRTMVNGRVFVEGRAREDADVVVLLQEAGIPCKLLTTEVLREPARFTRELTESAEKGVSVVVDGMCDEDLRSVILGVLAANVPNVVVGSGGITAALAEHELTLETKRSVGAQARPGEHPLVVSGSYSPTSHAQVERLVAAGFSHVKILPRKVLDVAPQVGAALSSSGCVISIAEEDEKDLSQANTLAGALADSAVAGMSQATSVIVSGGQTAFAILQRLGVNHIVIEGEVAPGVIASRVPGYEPQLITKSGAFGDEHTLLRVAS